MFIHTVEFEPASLDNRLRVRSLGPSTKVAVNRQFAEKKVASSSEMTGSYPQALATTKTCFRQQTLFLRPEKPKTTAKFSFGNKIGSWQKGNSWPPQKTCFRQQTLFLRPEKPKTTAKFYFGNKIGSWQKGNSWPPQKTCFRQQTLFLRPEKPKTRQNFISATK